MIRSLMIALLLIGAASGTGWALAVIQAEPDIKGPVAALEHLLALDTCEIHQKRERAAMTRDAIESEMQDRRSKLAEIAPNFGAGPSASGPQTPFPIELTAEFDLVDQYGTRRTADDFRGKTYALFFGYASCEAICSAVLPDIANAMEVLDQEGSSVETVMISVDPARDTPEAMRKNLARWHKNLIGLTGSPEDLAKVRKLFQVEISEVGRDEKGEPIYAHGSLVYLIGPDGRLQTILPPVFSPEHLAKVIRGYVSAASAS